MATLDDHSDIFISYEWSKHDQVTALYNRLTSLGYSCWVDMKKNEPSKKVSAEISKGIEQCKVLLACVTKLYSESEGCCREVAYADDLHKPILPLILESKVWPVSGGLGIVFAQRHPIDFSDASQNMKWTEAEFDELLTLLDALKVKPTEVKHGTSQYSSSSLEHNDIFISYNWGKQNQIKALYNRLTGLGYSCWVDMKKMGPGQILNEEIAKGINACKVVLACVTKDYTESVNCKREVAMADSLKKPIIPLLMETHVWPVTTAMGMAFAGLLYTDFTDPQAQTSWDGLHFQDLIGRLNNLHIERNHTLARERSMCQMTSSMSIEDYDKRLHDANRRFTVGAIAPDDIIGFHRSNSQTDLFGPRRHSAAHSRGGNQFRGIEDVHVELHSRVHAEGPVWGVTQLHGSIYVICMSHVIEVYDSVSLKRQHDIVLNYNDREICAVDMTSCAENKCLYICCDNKVIWRVLVQAHPVTVEWMSIRGKNYDGRLSVTTEGHVLLGHHDPPRIDVFAKDCRHIESIQLPLDVRYPRQVVETSSRDYIVISKCERLGYTVLAVDRKGAIMRAYRGEGLNNGLPGGPVFMPEHVAVDKHGHVFVVDYANSQLLLLDSTLSSARVVIARRNQADAVIHPHRLYFCARSGLLIVGHWTGSNGWMDVYDVR